MESYNTIELSRLEYADDDAIEFAPAVLEDLRRVGSGFIAFGHGGLEIGGVLYGLRDGDRLNILAFAVLECEHALGPGFVLSAKDRGSDRTVVEAAGGLETVGWFRSHTRSGLTLDESDRERFGRYFGEVRSAGLVLKPTHWGPAEAAFFVRETGGEIFPLSRARSPSKRRDRSRNSRCSPSRWRPRPDVLQVCALLSPFQQTIWLSR